MRMRIQGGMRTKNELMDFFYNLDPSYWMKIWTAGERRHFFQMNYLIWKCVNLSPGFKSFGSDRNLLNSALRPYLWPNLWLTAESEMDLCQLQNCCEPCSLDYLKYNSRLPIPLFKVDSLSHCSKSTLYPTVQSRLPIPLFKVDFISHCLKSSSYHTVQSRLSIPLFKVVFLSHCSKSSSYTTVQSRLYIPLFKVVFLSHCSKSSSYPTGFFQKSSKLPKIQMIWIFNFLVKKKFFQSVFFPVKSLICWSPGFQPPPPSQANLIKSN